jgi:hypothetical protein
MDGSMAAIHLSFVDCTACKPTERIRHLEVSALGAFILKFLKIIIKIISIIIF